MGGRRTSITKVPFENLAGRAGFEPAHGVSNSHVPFQLGYRPKTGVPARRFCAVGWKKLHKNQKAPTFVGAFENLNLN
jgi:hypothetical protein